MIALVVGLAAGYWAGKNYSNQVDDWFNRTFK